MYRLRGLQQRTKSVCPAEPWRSFRHQEGGPGSRYGKKDQASSDITAELSTHPTNCVQKCQAVSCVSTMDERRGLLCRNRTNSLGKAKGTSVGVGTSSTEGSQSIMTSLLPFLDPGGDTLF